VLHGACADCRVLRKKPAAKAAGASHLTTTAEGVRCTASDQKETSPHPREAACGEPHACPARGYFFTTTAASVFAAGVGFALADAAV
jgi:hypothetical protein